MPLVHLVLFAGLLSIPSFQRFVAILVVLGYFVSALTPVLVWRSRLRRNFGIWASPFASWSVLWHIVVMEEILEHGNRAEATAAAAWHKADGETAAHEQGIESMCARIAEVQRHFHTTMGREDAMESSPNLWDSARANPPRGCPSQNCKPGDGQDGGGPDHGARQASC